MAVFRSPISAMHQNHQLTGFVSPVGSLMLTCAETPNDVEPSTAPAHISIGDCTTSQMSLRGIGKIRSQRFERERLRGRERPHQRLWRVTSSGT